MFEEDDVGPFQWDSRVPLVLFSGSSHLSASDPHVPTAEKIKPILVFSLGHCMMRQLEIALRVLLTGQNL